MTGQPLVSVLMSLLDPHPIYFPEAVRSVLCQTHENLELIIVEDPSRASGSEMLQEFDDPRIRHYANRARTSHIRQRNKTLQYARSDLVAILDADDIAEPERIAKQVAFLEEHPEVSVLGSQLTIIDETGGVRAQRYYPTDHGAIVKALRRYNPLAQPAVLARKKVITSAGGYRYEKYPANEDYEVWCRLARSGVRFANHPECLTRYRVHPSSMKSEKLRGILRGTLDVKKMYWQGEMDVGDQLRSLGERFLLCLPSAVILRLFMWTQLSMRVGGEVPGNGASGSGD